MNGPIQKLGIVRLDAMGGTISGHLANEASDRYCRDLNREGLCGNRQADAA